MDIYREEFLDHYHNPRNYGEIIDANAIMELENVSCGDKIKLWVNIKDGKIRDIKFQGEGCAVAIASTSVLTEYATGKSIEALLKMDFAELSKLLKVEFTISRIKCASLGLETLKKALNTVDRL